MATLPRHRLIDVEWPEFGEVERPPVPEVAEFEARLDSTRAAMHRLDLTHLIIYGDREHFANLAYLTGFDPRFEEAALILSLQGFPLLLVGNECEGYLPVSPLYENGKLRSELYQPFSLLNQPRDDSRLIKEILTEEGIGKGAAVGCIGWKYFANSEHPDSAHAIDLPAYLVDTLRELAGWQNVTNATGILMDPDTGLRTYCSLAEIAFFEYAAYLASEGMKRMIFGIRDGMTDHEVVRLIEYSGEPLGCHMTLATRDRPGLASPNGTIIRRGEALSTNLCYWGGNSCRAGWVAASPSDLPAKAQDYVENFAGPYFEVLCEWLGLLQIGTPGSRLAALIDQKLPFEKYGISLNAGHIIHLDEWVSSPIYRGSDIPIHSGMAIQADVIPVSQTYFSTRMEDGMVIADSHLRQQLQERYPECYSRCQERRAFMRHVLGIQLSEEVLPLSNIPAIVPPFFLSPNTIFALEQ